MASILKVDTIQDQSGNNIINESADTITIGASGDTITIPSGATLSSTDPLVFPAGTASLPAVTTTGDTNTGIFFPAADTIGFAEGGSERMRIDSSGNLLVANTSGASTDTGHIFSPAGVGFHVRDGGVCLVVDRQTSDGDLQNFRKDGTVVGSIGVSNGDNLYIGGDVAGHGGIGFGSTSWIPRSGGAFANDAVDIGNNGNRMKDIYATNGTINTSDQNEKQSIQSLTTAEMNVAKRLSSLIKTFKWNNAVEKKGDSARTHTGIIAQDIQQAFTDEGLDASNYALFISGTWWEKEIFVDAVAEEVDENGNIITEAKDAYTYMDTKEEATDGYTEITRLGVRYSELLSFIQAYNDQRFTELEARITTLENK
jgi:hypothetical protein